MESKKENLTTFVDKAKEQKYSDSFANPFYSFSLLMFEDYSEQFSDTCPELRT